MNLPKIKADLLRKLNIENPATAPSYIVDDVLTAMNSAGQFMNSAGHPFWLPRTDSVAFGAVTEADLANARAVIAVRRQNGTPLFRTKGKHDFQNFEQIYGAAKSGLARCFLVQPKEPASDATLVLSIGPSDLDAQTLEIECTPVFERWALADLDDAALSPSMPSDYIETLFLPVARFYVTRSHFFSNEELQVRIESDFSTAIGLIRAINPKVSLPSDAQLKRNYATGRPVARTEGGAE